MKMEEKRAKDREDDKREMKTVIDNCLSEKIAEAIAPIKEKTNEVVTAQVKMNEQVELLMGEVSTLKGRV